MNTSKSIRNLVPLDVSGRHARKGFLYQDHIAVGLCITMLNSSTLSEIWLETHDDIILFWEDKDVITVEFVQVKAINQQSRWSVPSICGSGNPRDSIVKKLMDQDRCDESVLFRIVSSYDVNKELSVLKMAIRSAERIADSKKEDELSEKIKKQIGDVKSPNGKTVSDWVKLCWWEKKAENLQDLVNSNKIALEIALNSLGRPIYSDQRDEIYQKMLSYCQTASTGDLSMNSDCYKVIRQKLVGWLTMTIDTLYTSSKGGKKLEEKLKVAKNVPEDYISNARQLKYDYLQKRLTNDFIQPSEMSDLEKVIHGELFKMKIALDNGDLDEEQFHKLCINKLDEIRKSAAFKNKNIPDYIFSGYMYDLASKCIHRFRKVQA